MMKKVALSILFALVVGIVLIGCSDDPRVAPKKIYIVDTDEVKNRVAYSNSEGLRVIYMKPTIDENDPQTVQLAAITNRLNEEGGIQWSSMNPEYATVDNTGLVTSKNQDGSTIIMVSAPGVKSHAVCIVYVRLGDIGASDPENMEGLFIKVSGNNGSSGTVVVDSFVVDAGDSLTFTWEDPGNKYTYDHFDWYLDSKQVLLATTDGNTCQFTYQFNSPGNQRIKCVAYAKDSYNHVEEVGYYTLKVTVNDDGGEI